MSVAILGVLIFQTYMLFWALNEIIKLLNRLPPPPNGEKR